MHNLESVLWYVLALNSQMAPLALRCIFLVKFPGVNGLTSY